MMVHCCAFFSHLCGLAKVSGNYLKSFAATRNMAGRVESEGDKRLHEFKRVNGGNRTQIKLLECVCSRNEVFRRKWFIKVC